MAVPGANFAGKCVGSKGLRNHLYVAQNTKNIIKTGLHYQSRVLFMIYCTFLNRINFWQINVSYKSQSQPLLVSQTTW